MGRCKTQIETNGKMGDFVEKSLVTVIIPVYNTENYIGRCLKSVIRQSYSNLEIIVIDDGSTDGSSGICRDIAGTDQRIKFVSKANEGAGYARNTGMDMARGDFLLFLDSDDYLLENCIERCMEVAEKESCDVIKFKWAEGKEEDYKGTSKKKKYQVISNKEAFESRKTDVCVWGKLLKRETVGDIRYPKVSTFDDEFITYKWIYRAKKIALLDEVYYYYFMSDNSIMRKQREKMPLEYMEAYEERKRFFLEQGEKRLFEISAKEYAIRLMLSFINYGKYETAEKEPDELLKMFYKEYDIGKHTANGLKEKASLCLFARMPGLFKWMLTMNRM